MIKGRSVFNCKTQRGLYEKEGIAYPTFSQDSFLLTSIIDAAYQRKIDVTGMKGETLMKK